MNIIKKQNGVYYTDYYNPFTLPQFKNWLEKNNLHKETILEPFAGANNIPNKLPFLNFQSYDITPNNKKVIKRDTILDFPDKYKVCITNPPWLYKTSAKRKNLFFPKQCKYDDIYKYCLELCLNYCSYLAILIPASFLQSGLFQSRLSSITFITKKLFSETDNPTCLAIFDKDPSNDFKIFENECFINTHNNLKKYLPPKNNSLNIQFNCPRGNLGLIAIDNTKSATIQFCKGSKILNDITHSSRSITRIRCNYSDNNFIMKLNEYIADFRKKTFDIFLTTFKGVRKDGHYRRRIDYTLAKDIIAYCQNYDRYL